MSVRHIGKDRYTYGPVHRDDQKNNDDREFPSCVPGDRNKTYDSYTLSIVENRFLDWPNKRTLTDDQGRVTHKLRAIDRHILPSG